MSALEEHLDRQAEKSQGFFWNRLRWELVAEHLPVAGSFDLVDVGAGPGFLGDFLRQSRPAAGYRYIEPIEGLERSLETRFGKNGNLRDAASFGDASHVTLLDVLEHQEDDLAFLADLAAKMAPGATLLLTVPAMPSLWSGWDVALGHYRRYTKAMLRSRVAGLPFAVEEISYLFPELLPLGILRRVQRPAGSSSGGEDASSAEFPDLPELLNSALYRTGRLSMRWRRRAPAGTSVFASLRRSA